MTLAAAAVDAPMLVARAAAFTTVAVTLPRQVGTAVLDTNTAKCDVENLRSEAVPMRHPNEARLVVLGCGAPATSAALAFLGTALRPYGWSVNCAQPDADGHFHHRFPDGTVDPHLLVQLYCYDPDRILYLYADHLASALDGAARGNATCGGRAYAATWDRSSQPAAAAATAAGQAEEVAANWTALAGVIDSHRHDVLGRHAHAAGWAVTNVPAPTLFVDLSAAPTTLPTPALLAAFLGVPRVALAGWAAAVTPHRRPSPPAAAALVALDAGIPLRQLYANLRRAGTPLHRTLLVPEGFVDRLRAMATGPRTSVAFLPPASLYCPARPSDATAATRDAVVPAVLPALLAPSHALMPLSDLLPTHCGPTWTAMLAEYAEWHAATRARLLANDTINTTEAPPAIVVWRCPRGDTPWGCGGMADRLVGMASVFVFSVLFRRFLLLDLAEPGASDGLPGGNNSNGTAALPLLPALDALDWRWDARLVAHDEAAAAVEYDLFNCNTGANAAPCLWNTARPGAAISAAVAYISTNRGFLGGVQGYAPLKRLGLSPPIAAQCVYRSLWRPSPAIAARVAAFLPPRVGAGEPVAGRPAVLGVHFRGGDDGLVLEAGGGGGGGGESSHGAAATVAVRQAALTDAVTACLARLLTAVTSSGTPAHVLLAGDSAAGRRLIAANITALAWPAPVNVTIVADAPAHIEGAVYRTRNAPPPPPASAADNALTEWLLLAAADTRLLTYSGYSRTAWAFSGSNYAVLAANNLDLAAPPVPECRIVSLPTLALNMLAAGL
mgnify:CR=1 FL=1